MFRILSSLWQVIVALYSHEGAAAMNNLRKQYYRFWWCGLGIVIGLLLVAFLASAAGWTKFVLLVGVVIAVAIGMTLTYPPIVLTGLLGFEVAKRVFRDVEDVARDFFRFVLYVLITSEAIVLLCALASLGKHSTAFLVAAIALGGIAAPMWALFPKVFPGNTGKKLVHAGAIAVITGCVVMVLATAVPKERWHATLGFYPLDVFTTTESEQTAQALRETEFAQADEAMQGELDGIKKKLNDKKKLSIGEAALIRLYKKATDGEQFFAADSMGFTLVSRGPGYDVKIVPLNNGQCIAVRTDGTDRKPIGPEGKDCGDTDLVSVSEQREKGTDVELKSLDGSKAYVRVVYTRRSE